MGNVAVKKDYLADVLLRRKIVGRAGNVTDRLHKRRLANVYLTIN